MLLAPLDPDRLREAVVAGRDVVDHHAPLPPGVDGPQRSRVLHVGRAEEGALLLQGCQAVHRQVGAQQHVLTETHRERSGGD